MIFKNFKNQCLIIPVPEIEGLLSIVYCSVSSHSWCLSAYLWLCASYYIKKINWMIIWGLGSKCLALHKTAFISGMSGITVLESPWKTNKTVVQTAMTCEGSSTCNSHSPWRCSPLGLSLLWGGSIITFPTLSGPGCWYLSPLPWLVIKTNVNTCQT